MTRPLPASVLLLPTVTARLIKSTWDQRNILISWERIAVFSASVLSHKFVYKSGGRWQEFHRRFWSKRRVGDGGWWFRYSGGSPPPVRGLSDEHPAGSASRSGRRTSARPGSTKRRRSA